MTDPDIAAVRDALAAHRSDSMLLDGRYYEFGGKKQHDEYEVALARVEAKLEAAEKALAEISAVRLNDRDTHPCHQARIAMQTIARRALAGKGAG